MRSKRSLLADERGIEGLPIRLVIALVVGVAVLSLMMGILGGFSFGGQAEVDVQPDTSVLTGTGDVQVTVVTADGEPVEGARVIAESGTLTLNQPIPNNNQKTGQNGQATITLNGYDWRNNQEKGTVTFSIRVPGDSGMVDNSPNTKITVIRSSSSP